MEQPSIRIEDWGLIDYDTALDRQTRLYEEAIGNKLQQLPHDNVAILCEHPPVYTIGKSGKDSNMLLNAERLGALGVKLHHIKRGGDITFHGPEQIVMYPIIDLDQFGLGLKDYVNLLEEAVITTCSTYGINCCRLKGATGVWIDADKPVARKICAIGVQSSHFVTMHGLAFNVNTDLSYFHYINPCGFVDKGVTSLALECGHTMDIEEVKRKLTANFITLIGQKG